jgi:signal transduction histidine kinase
VALTDVRRLVDGLRPPALDELGLVEAVRQQAARLEAGGAAGTPTISVEADPRPLPELSAAVEVAAYRIAVEALTNTVRHAGATTCRVLFDATDAGTLRLEVVDDGRGLRSGVVPGVGLESMRERADELGGAIVIEAANGAGTRVVARLPIATVARPGPRSVDVPESAVPDTTGLAAPEAHRA